MYFEALIKESYIEKERERVREREREREKLNVKIYSTVL